MKPKLSEAASLKAQQLEEEIDELRKLLLKPHLAKSSEQDYKILSQIIDKQNELIELLMGK